MSRTCGEGLRARIPARVRSNVSAANAEKPQRADAENCGCKDCDRFEMRDAFVAPGSGADQCDAHHAAHTGDPDYAARCAGQIAEQNGRQRQGQRAYRKPAISGVFSGCATQIRPSSITAQPKLALNRNA